LTLSSLSVSDLARAAPQDTGPGHIFDLRSGKHFATAQLRDLGLASVP
jgi:hypothetical protein